MNIQINFFREDFIEAISAGIYEISVQHDGRSAPLYIGESVFALVRCASHLYRLKNRPEYFGFTDETINDPSIALTFRLIKSDDVTVTRRSAEKEFIKEREPLSQSGNSDWMKELDEKRKALNDFLAGK